MVAAKKKKAPIRPAEVFLSHSHHDKAAVEKLEEMLVLHGVPVWYSETNIKGAQQWLDEIGEALERCDWFVVLLTPAAVKSQWVKRELTYALNEPRYGSRIVPLLLKKCDYKKLAWPLLTLQMIDFKSFPAGSRKLLALWGIGYKPK